MLFMTLRGTVFIIVWLAGLLHDCSLCAHNLLASRSALKNIHCSSFYFGRQSVVIVDGNRGADIF